MLQESNKRTYEPRVRPSYRRKNPHGWTNERRARQSLLIRNWQPWRLSTGPQTQEGKAASAKNAFKHGVRSRKTQEELGCVRAALRRAAAFVRIVKALIGALPRSNQAYCQIAQHRHAESAYQHTEHVIDRAHDAIVDMPVKNADECRQHEPPRGRTGENTGDHDPGVHECRLLSGDAGEARKQRGEPE